MRWTGLFIYIFICIAAVRSHPRGKRDLETILKIKKAIASSIFGTPNCTSTVNPEPTKVYRIPGHKDVFIEAMPIVQGPIKYIQSTPIAIHPSIAAVGSYLGTTTAEETLQALERVQKLLQSGLLTNNFVQTHPEQFRPPGIARPMHPLQSIYENIATGLYAPPQTSYSMSGSESSVRIPEPPTLPPLPPAVMFPENPRPMYVGPILDAPISLPEYSPPQVHEVIKPNGYSYQQIHGDGSVTTYTADSKIPEFVEVPTVEEVQAMPLPVNTGIPCGIHTGPCHLYEVFPPAGFAPIRVQNIADTKPGAGYSYHQVNLDGSVSTFTDKPLKVPDGYGGYIYQKIKEDGSFEAFLDADCIQPLPLNYFSDRKQTGYKQQVNFADSFSSPNVPPKLTAVPHHRGGYIYEQIHEDGTKTLYFDAEGKIKIPQKNLVNKTHPFPYMHPFMINRKDEIANTVSAEPRPLIPEPPKLPVNPTGFVYTQINGDGSTTTYTGNQPTETVKKQQELFKFPAPIPQFFPRPYIMNSPVMPIFEDPIYLPDYRPVEVKKIPSLSKHHHHNYNHHTFLPILPNPGLAPFPNPQQPFIFGPKPQAPSLEDNMPFVDVKPIASNYVNTQFSHDNSESKITVVNLDPPVKPVVLSGELVTHLEEDCDPTEGNSHTNSETDKIVAELLSENPIVVVPQTPKPYSYTQANNYGSSIIYEGSDSQMSVNVNNIHRGDIP